MWVTPKNIENNDQLRFLTQPYTEPMTQDSVAYNQIIQSIINWYKLSAGQCKLLRTMKWCVNNGTPLNRYCVPINHGNNHWVLLDCALRSEKFPNGMVKTIDHSIMSLIRMILILIGANESIRGRMVSNVLIWKTYYVVS